MPLLGLQGCLIDGCHVTRTFFRKRRGFLHSLIIEYTWFKQTEPSIKTLKVGTMAFKTLQTKYSHGQGEPPPEQTPADRRSLQGAPLTPSGLKK